MNIPTESEIHADINHSLLTVLDIYKSSKTWNERQQKSRQVLEKLNDAVPDQSSLISAIKPVIRQLLPKLTTDVVDSDTIRFYREAIRYVFAIDIIDTEHYCRICTYPDGFLDTYLDEEGICSACRTYELHKSELENRKHLEIALHEAIQEAKQLHSKYDVIVSFSGGKDSVFVLKQLVSKYHARVLCVLDDLNQQTEEAMENAKRAIDDLDADLFIISPPEEEPGIRRNFLKNGENFCRLCLRSHFARVYQIAIDRQIPYVFMGLSPFQVLDCPNAIDWSLHAIHDLETSPENRDNEDILNRYQHRFFQGGYDRGFVEENEKILLSKWMSTFEPGEKKIIPLLLPFFIFDGYPGDEKIMELIAHDVHWKKPDYYIFRRSNCRWQQPAGLIHYAIFQTHMNYKEIATELRIAGKRLTYEQAKEKFLNINQLSDDEKMEINEFKKILLNDFGMKIEEMPEYITNNIRKLLT